MESTTESGVQQYDLIGALQDCRWLKLPLAIMQDVGPAVQTFGGLLHKTNKETFLAAGKIADAAGVNISTYRKHLVVLGEKGWITNMGRKRPDHGRTRRTCTLQISAHASRLVEPYSILPWWAMRTPERDDALSWSSKAVLSIVMSRLASPSQEYFR